MVIYLYGVELSGREALLLAVCCLLFWLVVIGGLRVILHDGSSGGRRHRGPRSPEDVLFQRFVDGEIDDDEYRHGREALRGTPQPCARA
jgi:uncharacterized membrane protein